MNHKIYFALVENEIIGNIILLIFDVQNVSGDKKNVPNFKVIQKKT